MARQENSFYEYRDRNNRIKDNKRKMDEADREMGAYEAMDSGKRTSTDKQRYQFNKNVKSSAEPRYNYDLRAQVESKQGIPAARYKALKELASSGTTERLAQAGRTAQAAGRARVAQAKTAQTGVASGAQAMGTAMRRPTISAAPRPAAQPARPVARPAAQAQAGVARGAAAMGAAMRRR
jgi:hypothetical protein